MLKVIQSPAKYLQGPDAAVLFGQYAKNLAESFFVIADDFVMKLAGEKVVNGLQSHDIRCHAERFNGECSHAEINRLMAILQKQGCRGVVGIGGGKTLDTAKAIGYYQKLPVVVIPTIASTDAPTSALSVIYTEAGEFEEYLIYPKNPDMVVMDTAIIAKAPVRLL
ncbi:glycerol dehydrogenase, partial [Klebsiella pneumoniae]